MVVLFAVEDSAIGRLNYLFSAAAKPRRRRKRSKRPRMSAKAAFALLGLSEEGFCKS